MQSNDGLTAAEDLVITDATVESAYEFIQEQGASPNMLRHKSEAVWLMTRFADQHAVELSARLEAAEKERDALNVQLDKVHRRRLNAECERDTLRAEVERLRQSPPPLGY